MFPFLSLSTATTYSYFPHIFHRRRDKCSAGCNGNTSFSQAYLDLETTGMCYCEQSAFNSVMKCQAHMNSWNLSSAPRIWNLSFKNRTLTLINTKIERRSQGKLVTNERWLEVKKSDQLECFMALDIGWNWPTSSSSCFFVAFASVLLLTHCLSSETTTY